MNWLKLILWFTAVCCFTGFVAAALPWKIVVVMCSWADFDVSNPAPVVVYVYRLCSAVFGLVGVFFLILARNPFKYGAMLPLAGYGIVLYGLFCLAGGLRYGLKPWMYAGDAVFGILVGAAILWFASRGTTEEAIAQIRDVQ